MVFPRPLETFRRVAGWYALLLACDHNHFDTAIGVQAVKQVVLGAEKNDQDQNRQDVGVEVLLDVGLGSHPRLDIHDHNGNADNTNSRHSASANTIPTTKASESVTPTFLTRNDANHLGTEAAATMTSWFHRWFATADDNSFSLKQHSGIDGTNVQVALEPESVSDTESELEPESVDSTHMATVGRSDGASRAATVGAWIFSGLAADSSYWVFFKLGAWIFSGWLLFIVVVCEVSNKHFSETATHRQV
jgi:hypothetical protein